VAQWRTLNVGTFMNRVNYVYLTELKLKSLVLFPVVLNCVYVYMSSNPYVMPFQQLSHFLQLIAGFATIWVPFLGHYNMYPK
jgi:hypothetical protein